MIGHTVIVRNAAPMDRPGIVLELQRRNQHLVRILVPGGQDFEDTMPVFSTELEMHQWLETGNPRRRAAFEMKPTVEPMLASLESDLIEAIKYGERTRQLDADTQPPLPGESKTEIVPDADAVVFGEPVAVALDIVEEAKQIAEELAAREPPVLTERLP